MFDQQFGHSIRTILIIFFVAILIGFIIVSFNPKVGIQLMTFLKNEIFLEVSDKSSLALFFKILLNNLEACLLIFLGGVSLGAISILIITLNGFVIGSVIATVRGEHGLLFMAAAILPHGVFEIPAFVTAGALGLSLAREVWLEVKGRGDAANVAQTLGMIFIKDVVPLITLAAFIEAFITPYIITLV